MGKKAKFIALISLLTGINVCIFIYSNLQRSNKLKNSVLPVILKNDSNESISALYDQTCPEIILSDIKRNNISLTSWVGDVIILKFSRFYKSELPGLLYLEHLATSLKNHGVHLILINSLGKHDRLSIEKYANFSVPIVENNGSLSALLNAHPTDLIIIDRSFKIKYKNAMFNKPYIYGEVMRWAYGEGYKKKKIEDADLQIILSKLKYLDVNDNEYKTLFPVSPASKTVVTIFTSTCLTCQENARLRLFKDFTNTDKYHRIHLILLFGKGNTPESIRQYSALNELSKYGLSTGIIMQSNDLSEQDYYSLFEFNIDPRTFILDSKGGILFSENLKNSSQIKISFLKSYI
jgi:hypothetical protein